MDESKFHFVVASTHGVARAYAVPLFLTEEHISSIDLSPFVISQKDVIVQQLMEEHTKPELLGKFESIGLSARGHSKKPKPEVAGLMADKLIENLIANEEENAAIRAHHIASAKSALALTNSLENEDGQTFFKHVIREAIGKGSSSEKWQDFDELSLGLLEVGREHIPNFMEEEY